MKIFLIPFLLCGFCIVAHSQARIPLNLKEAKAKNIYYSIDASVAQEKYGVIDVTNKNNAWNNRQTNYNSKSFWSCIGNNNDKTDWIKQIKKSISKNFTKPRLVELANENIHFVLAFSPQGNVLGMRFLVNAQNTKITLAELEDIELSLMKDIKLNFKCQDKIKDYNFIPFSIIVVFSEL